ncbi:hypothetical protein [Alkalihalobacillus pseudalcaliphilus]|uniref:hypothetical protein n=1 Tax=Alkalihalobacillus pseudalcaliphilus TaxID=79884 RepID=UPI000A4EBAB7
MNHYHEQHSYDGYPSQSYNYEPHQHHVTHVPTHSYDPSMVRRPWGGRPGRWGGRPGRWGGRPGFGFGYGFGGPFVGGFLGGLAANALFPGGYGYGYPPYYPPYYYY